MSNHIDYRRACINEGSDFVLPFIILSFVQVILLLSCCMAKASCTSSKKSDDDGVIREVRELEKSSACTCATACSGALWVLLWVWVAYIDRAVLSCPYGWPRSGTSEYALSILAIIWIVVLVLYLFIESACCSSEKDYVKNIGENCNVEEQINEYIGGAPVVNMVAKGYHYETRHSTTTTNGRTTTTSHTEKVYTRTETKQFAYSRWFNKAVPNMDNLRAIRGITKVKINLFIEWGNAESSQEFNRQFELFKAETHSLDTHVEHSHSMELPGFESRLTAFGGNAKPPSWMNTSWLFCCSCLLLGWLYRAVFNSKTHKIRYRMVKHVICNASAPPPTAQQIGFAFNATTVISQPLPQHPGSYRSDVPQNNPANGYYQNNSVNSYGWNATPQEDFANGMPPPPGNEFWNPVIPPSSQAGGAPARYDNYSIAVTIDGHHQLPSAPPSHPLDSQFLGQTVNTLADPSSPPPAYDDAILMAPIVTTPP